MAQAVIASAVRTPIGAFTGAQAGVLGQGAGRRRSDRRRAGLAMVVERPEGAPGG